MSLVKSAILNLRIQPALKEALKEAAAVEHRSVSNLVEVLIREHCSRVGIVIPEQHPLFQDS